MHVKLDLMGWVTHLVCLADAAEQLLCGRGSPIKLSLLRAIDGFLGGFALVVAVK